MEGSNKGARPCRLHLLELPSFPGPLASISPRDTPTHTHPASAGDSYLTLNVLGSQENAQDCGGTSDTSASHPLLLLPLCAWVLTPRLLQ